MFDIDSPTISAALHHLANYRTCLQWVSLSRVTKRPQRAALNTVLTHTPMYTHVYCICGYFGRFSLYIRALTLPGYLVGQTFTSHSARGARPQLCTHSVISVPLCVGVSVCIWQLQLASDVPSWITFCSALLCCDFPSCIDLKLFGPDRSELSFARLGLAQLSAARWRRRRDDYMVM